MKTIKKILEKINSKILKTQVKLGLKTWGRQNGKLPEESIRDSINLESKHRVKVTAIVRRVNGDIEEIPIINETGE